MYRRLSGKRGYERVPTQDEPFEETLKQTRKKEHMQCYHQKNQ
jgi:hypothetical protein